MKTKKEILKKISAVLITALFFIPHPVLTQSIEQMDEQAQEFFDNKDFSKAVALWLNILDIDPNNMEVQKKVEFLYETKQKKDLELEKSKINYKLAKREITKNFEKGVSIDDAEKNLFASKGKAKLAFQSFFIAYRIDPKDSEMRLIREDMEKLDKLIASEEKRLSVTKEQREKAMALAILAKKAMDESRFKDAYNHWNDILAFMPENIEAIEGKRQCLIALDNIIRYESIKKFMASGINFFVLQEYKQARDDFMTVLQLDPENIAAQDYLEKIDEKLNSKKQYEKRLREAEIFYASGIKNLKNNKFDEARDEFENALTLISDYKDAKQKLDSIPRLKAEYEKREKERKLKIITEQFQTGLIALSDQRYQDAIAAFEIILKLDPENKLVPVYMQRAKDAQKFEEEEIVDENSTYFSLVQSLAVSGKSLYDSGKYEESKKRWTQILELFPANKLANEYIFKCELQLNPSVGEAMAKKIIQDGEDFLKKREFRNAYRKFVLVKSIYPDYPDIDNLLKKSRREEYLTASVLLTPQDKIEMDRRYNLGMAYYQKGGDDNLKKALVELKWVASKDPGYVKAVVAVNRIESQIRSGGGPLKAEVSKLTPEQEALVRKYYYSGINFYSNNDFKRAIAEWRKVLAIDPNHTRAKNNIRKCLALLGQ
jgi:tetratricopeptide (TPR) repeat protein